jgi:hypothetical protein
MRGLLADANIEGHVMYLRQLLAKLELDSLLSEQGIEFVFFSDLNLAPDVNDRLLWNRCQQERLTLFTDNRNRDDTDSLQATLDDSWQPGNLPVLTLSDKRRFEDEPDYAERVAYDVVELLLDFADRRLLNRPRIFVPVTR